MVSEQLLDIRELGKKYGKQWVVEEVSFSLKQGDVFGLIGENGAGKSTVLSMLATLTTPSNGIIQFHGTDIQKIKKEYRGKIGYVPQEIALFEELTGYENLNFFAKAYHIPKNQRKERIQQVAETVSLPELFAKKPVREYSGGMKRKLNIAAALVHRPELLLLDEPTANIDVWSEEQIISVIKKLAGNQIGVIYIGHQFERIEQLCNRFGLMKNGRMIYQNTIPFRNENSHETSSLKQLCEYELGDKKEQDSK